MILGPSLASWLVQVGLNWRFAIGSNYKFVIGGRPSIRSVSFRLATKSG
jgi:hypothetical protein